MGANNAKRNDLLNERRTPWQEHSGESKDWPQVFLQKSKLFRLCPTIRTEIAPEQRMCKIKGE
jgi:hypothetical protein